MVFWVQIHCSGNGCLWPSPDGDSLFYKRLKIVSKKLRAPTYGPNRLDVAGEKRSRALELALIEWLKAGAWLWFGGVATPHPSPLPREREPISVSFETCIRLGIARRHTSAKHLGQFPLPREREPISVGFETCIRLGIAHRRTSAKHLGQSPLPREREPISVGFETCIRLGIAYRRSSAKHLGQSPLPPGEG